MASPWPPLGLEYDLTLLSCTLLRGQASIKPSRADRLPCVALPWFQWWVSGLGSLWLPPGRALGSRIQRHSRGVSSSQHSDFSTRG